MTLTTDAPLTAAWPFCPECRAERSLRLTAGAVLCLAALLPAASLLLTAPLIAFTSGGAAGVTGLLCAVLLGGGLGLIASGAWPALSGASLSRDGAWLLVDADPAFANEVLQTPAARDGHRVATSVRFSSTFD